VAYNKHRQNLRHKDNRNGWNQIFRGGEADIRLVVAYNVHEADRIGRVQEGGTGLLMFGPLTEYLDMPGSERYNRPWAVDNNATQGRHRCANKDHMRV
jgi:hypothetical protein